MCPERTEQVCTPFKTRFIRIVHVQHLSMLSRKPDTDVRNRMTVRGVNRRMRSHKEVVVRLVMAFAPGATAKPEDRHQTRTKRLADPIPEFPNHGICRFLFHAAILELDPTARQAAADFQKAGGAVLDPDFALCRRGRSRSTLSTVHHARSRRQGGASPADSRPIGIRVDSRRFAGNIWIGILCPRITGMGANREGDGRNRAGSRLDIRHSAHFSPSTDSGRTGSANRRAKARRRRSSEQMRKGSSRCGWNHSAVAMCTASSVRHSARR